jgi:hypothetical protein
MTTEPQDLASTLARIADALDSGNVIWALNATPTLIEQASTLQAQLVAELRDAGESWATIATALGTTRQSAWERFNAH